MLVLSAVVKDVPDLLLRYKKAKPLGNKSSYAFKVLLK